MAIGDQPLQQTGRHQSWLAHGLGAQRCEDGLRLVELLTLDDWLVLPLVDLSLVRDLTVMVFPQLGGHPGLAGHALLDSNESGYESAWAHCRLAGRRENA